MQAQDLETNPNSVLVEQDDKTVTVVQRTKVSKEALRDAIVTFIEQSMTYEWWRSWQPTAGCELPARTEQYPAKSERAAILVVDQGGSLLLETEQGDRVLNLEKLVAGGVHYANGHGRTLEDVLEDADMNDVDAIVQRAVFDGAEVYG